MYEESLERVLREIRTAIRATRSDRYGTDATSSGYGDHIDAAAVDDVTVVVTDPTASDSLPPPWAEAAAFAEDGMSVGVTLARASDRGAAENAGLPLGDRNIIGFILIKLCCIQHTGLFEQALEGISTITRDGELLYQRQDHVMEMVDRRIVKVLWPPTFGSSS